MTPGRVLSALEAALSRHQLLSSSASTRSVRVHEFRPFARSPVVIPPSTIRPESAETAIRFLNPDV
jgi:hypothetical protein